MEGNAIEIFDIFVFFTATLGDGLQALLQQKLLPLMINFKTAQISLAICQYLFTNTLTDYDVEKKLVNNLKNNF